VGDIGGYDSLNMISAFAPGRLSHDCAHARVARSAARGEVAKVALGAENRPQSQLVLPKALAFV